MTKQSWLLNLNRWCGINIKNNIINIEINIVVQLLLRLASPLISYLICDKTCLCVLVLLAEQTMQTMEYSDILLLDNSHVVRFTKLTEFQNFTNVCQGTMVSVLIEMCNEFPQKSEFDNRYMTSHYLNFGCTKIIHKENLVVWMDHGYFCDNKQDGSKAN